MKLTDISATGASRVATAKLAHQVQKASVAAGKEPRTNLAVVGISLGQAQSTGDTSRVTLGTALGGTKKTPMLRRPMGPVNESISAADAWELLERLGDEINEPLVPAHLARAEFNKSEVAEAAVYIMRLYFADEEETAYRILNLLSTVRTHSQSAISVVRPVADVQQTIVADLDSVLFPELKQLLTAASEFTESAAKISGTIDMIQSACEFIEMCHKKTVDVHAPAHQASFCRAALKRLGMLK